jgi:hypothetical protein
VKKLFLMGILFGLAVVPALASTIEFGPGGDNAGGWTYNGAGTITLQQTINVKKGLGSGSDALVGAIVYLPEFSVGGIPGGPYTLTPLTSTILIKNQSDSITYLSGTLGSGDLFPSPTGTTALGYTDFQMDITNVIVNNAIGSDALAVIAAMTNPELDFELSFQGAPSSGFKWMLDNYKPGNDGFSGAMTAEDIPEPATICLFGFGALSLTRRKKH